MFCSKCGLAVAEGAAFCGGCGQPAGAPMPGAGVYAAPTATVASSQVLYAGFWLRFVAIIIDLAVLGIALGIPMAIIFGAMGLSMMGRSPDEMMGAGFGVIALFELISFVGQWLYFASMESSSWQGTLGKKALGLMVTDMNGQRISFGRASGRYFGKILSGLTLLIGYIMAGFTAKKQALHDMIAGCLVIRRA
jgi:uncharacterized RDD family membrane protein YckC